MPPAWDDSSGPAATGDTPHHWKNTVTKTKQPPLVRGWGSRRVPNTPSRRGPGKPVSSWGRVQWGRGFLRSPRTTAVAALGLGAPKWGRAPHPSRGPGTARRPFLRAWSPGPDAPPPWAGTAVLGLTHATQGPASPRPWRLPSVLATAGSAQCCLPARPVQVGPGPWAGHPSLRTLGLSSEVG